MSFTEMTPDEMKFFETGMLPESLQPEVTPAPETPAPEVPAVEKPAPAVEDTAVEPVAKPEPTIAETVRDLLDASSRQMQEAHQRQMDSLKKQLEEMQAAAKKPQIPEDIEPDPNQDPLGHMQWQMRAIQKQITGFQEAQTAKAASVDQQNQATSFINAVNKNVTDFKNSHADYDAAYKLVVDTRMQDYRDLGYSDADAKQLVGQEEGRIAIEAMKAGKNPAEVVYKMAARMGHKAPAAPVTPENKLETLKKGHEAAQGVERGSPPEKGELTIKSLDGMSNRDLNKVVEDRWDELFGKNSVI